jgi:hypothetical protein
MENDRLGLPKRIVAMDAHGRPMVTKNGVAITECTHDAMGNLTEIRFSTLLASRPSTKRVGPG